MGNCLFEKSHCIFLWKNTKFFRNMQDLIDKQFLLNDFPKTACYSSIPDILFL